MTDAPGTATWDLKEQGDPPANWTGRVNVTGPRGGKSHWYALSGERVEGVTTIISQGVSKGDVLSRWAAGKVAEAAVNSQGYWRRLNADEAITFLKRSPYRDKSEAGLRGTEVHRYAEEYGKTGVVTPPEDVDEIIRDQVGAFGRFAKDFDVSFVVNEAVVFNRAELYAGTLDAIVDLTLPEVGRQRWLLDWKSAKGIYPETSLQLAAYRYASFYVNADGDQVGMPGVDGTGVLHLPASGGYRLIPMQADRVIYRTFLRAKELAHFVANGKAVIGQPIEPPT